MKAALFVPCYVDAFFPEVGIATLELLERLGVEVDYPLEQTCCGQPMGNSGCEKEAAATEALFVKNFAGFEYIVTPSGSCTHHVRENLTAVRQTRDTIKVRKATYELVEFVHDVLKVREFPWAEFPHAVGLHNGCASLRALRTAKMSEIDEPFFSKPLDLLSECEGHPLRYATASRRMLRIRRNILGVRGASVGEDGVRQGDRSPEGGRGIHRLRRHVVPHASARMCGAAGAADQVHPHCADPERGTGMRRIDHAEASSKFIRAKDHLDFHDQRLWDLRQKRDRESEQSSRVGAVAHARLRDQGAYADASR